MGKYMKTGKSLAVFFLLMICISSFNTLVCYGNSAEPPSIVIIVPGAPKDLEISVAAGGTVLNTRKTGYALETHFSLYSLKLNKETYTLQVKSNAKDMDYTITTAKPLERYNNVYTLDLKQQKLSAGKSMGRSVLLVTLRVILTLLIEAGVYYIFGFREKRSWLIFVLINLITQGFLNIWINNSVPSGYQLYFGMLFAEVQIFIVEAILFVLFLKEHKRGRKIWYALISNLVSFIAGGYLISFLSF